MRRDRSYGRAKKEARAAALNPLALSLMASSYNMKVCKKV